MRTRRTSAVVAVLATAALVVTGCARGDSSGNPDDEAPREGESINLTFQSLAFQTDAVASTKEIVDAWNAENPDVQVELVQGQHREAGRHVPGRAGQEARPHAPDPAPEPQVETRGLDLVGREGSLAPDDAGRREGPDRLRGLDALTPVHHVIAPPPLC